MLLLIEIGGIGMNNDYLPLREIVIMIKGRLRIRDKELKNILEFGHELVRKEKRKINNKDREEFHIVDIGEDSIRKLRRQKKLTIETLCQDDEGRRNFVSYCNILSQGIYHLSEEEDNVLNLISNDIQELKNEVLKYIDSYRESNSIDSDIIGGENVMKNKDIQNVDRKIELNIIKLNEEILDFLSESEIGTQDDWDKIEENINFDKYVVVNKIETFMFKEEYDQANFMLIETSLDGKVYFLSITSTEEINIQKLDSMEEALTLLMEEINFNQAWLRRLPNYKDDYDTLMTLKNKVQNLLC